MYFLFGKKDISQDSFTSVFLVKKKNHIFSLIVEFVYNIDLSFFSIYKKYITVTYTF